MILKYRTRYEYILSSCDGSCGNNLGKFIANIIKEDDNDNNNNSFLLTKQEKLDIISHKFGEYGNIMRDYLIKLMNDSNNNNKINRMFNINNDLILKLENENVYISHNLSIDEKWIKIFIKFFKFLLKSDKWSIIEKLLNKSCKRYEMELFEEIEQNTILQRFDFDKCHIRIEKVKQTEYYKIMKLNDKGLTNNEIISIIFYVTNKFILNDIQINNNNNSCKWKQLFNNLHNAITKIYKIFIYQNKQNIKYIPKQLYHFINGDCHKISKNHTKNSLNPWIFNKINILQNNCNDIDINIGGNGGCLLSLINIKNNLFDGHVIAAPIDWIIQCNNHHNQCNNNKIYKQWLSLPTIFKTTKFQHQKQNISYWQLSSLSSDS